MGTKEAEGDAGFAWRLAARGYGVEDGREWVIAGWGWLLGFGWLVGPLAQLGCPKKHFFLFSFY